MPSRGQAAPEKPPPKHLLGQKRYSQYTPKIKPLLPEYVDYHRFIAWCVCHLDEHFRGKEKTVLKYMANKYMSRSMLPVLDRICKDLELGYETFVVSVKEELTAL